MKQLESGIWLPNQTAPGNAPSGYTGLYMKSDGKAYTKDTAGLETALGGADAGYYKIAETDVGGTPPANIDIQSIPSTYRHLHIIASLRSDAVTTLDVIAFSVNNDTTNANYDREYLRANANTPTGVESLLTRNVGVTAAASSAAGLTGINHIFIVNYAQTTLFKVMRVSTSAWTTRSAGGLFVQEALVGWASTAAINRVTLAPVTGTHWAAGSTVSVYGVLAGA